MRSSIRLGLLSTTIIIYIYIYIHIHIIAINAMILSLLCGDSYYLVDYSVYCTSF